MYTIQKNLKKMFILYMVQADFIKILLLLFALILMEYFCQCKGKGIHI